MRTQTLCYLQTVRSCIQNYHAPCSVQTICLECHKSQSTSTYDDHIFIIDRGKSCHMNTIGKRFCQSCLSVTYVLGKHIESLPWDGNPFRKSTLQVSTHQLSARTAITLPLPTAPASSTADEWLYGYSRSQNNIRHSRTEGHHFTGELVSHDHR